MVVDGDDVGSDVVAAAAADVQGWKSYNLPRRDPRAPGWEEESSRLAAPDRPTAEVTAPTRRE